MGTNYYVSTYETDAEGVRTRTNEEHVGKYSGGWTFTFQGRNQRTVEAWRERLSNLKPNEVLESEYRYEVSNDEFWSMVEDSLNTWNGMSSKTNRPHTANDRNWVDGRYGFSAYEFF